MNTIPLNEYPRPQLKRDSYYCLNGIWSLSFLDEENNTQTYKITVPYSPETEASGVQRSLQPGECMCYSRTVAFPEEVDFQKERLLLHFGAVDYKCDIFIDGELTESHEGGYLPFTVEVEKTKFRLDVMVSDPSDTLPIARGKQSSKSEQIFYPGQSGIWQTVWMEKVPLEYIKNVIITPDLKGFDIVVVSSDGQNYPCTVRFGLKKHMICTDASYRIDIPNPQLWTPEFPNLYFFSIKMGEDKIITYTGLRTFGVKDGKLLLNGKPYYHHGVLEQGYYKNGLYTPINDQQMIDDITFAKKLGFNTIRKHAKVDCARWYFHCDSLGMLVWQDMVPGCAKINALSTALGMFTGAVVKDNDYQRFGREEEYFRKQWENETYSSVQVLFNSVCIAMWVVFNEGWGQFDSHRISEHIAEIDNSRTIDNTSGWYDQGDSQFKSLHVYGRKYSFKADSHKRPILLSEFGGYGLNLDDKNSKKKLFNYKKFNSKGELTDAIIKLYETQIIPAKKAGLAASIYTQLTDVEQENNGLISYDRFTVKVIAEDIASMSEELLEE